MNNLNPLPFYKSLEEQNHRKTHAFGNVFPLICSQNRLPPFQIVRSHSTSTLAAVSIVCFDTGVKTRVEPQLISAGLQIRYFPTLGYDLITNQSLLVLTDKLQEGFFYLEVSDGDGEQWYSDVFKVVADVSRFLKIEYWDDENFEHSNGHIDYTRGFKNYLYLDTKVGKPEYPFEETAKKRDGHTFIEKQISEKKYKFVFVAPEYLCDAVRIIRMHDNVIIRSEGQVYDVHIIMFSPKWQEQGDIASVEVEFECDTVIKKIGKSITPTQNAGDLNNDFNNDFNN